MIISIENMTMRDKLVDHLFTKIIEGRFEKSLSMSATRAKLEQLERVGRKILKTYGYEARENILGYSEVERALTQCLEYIGNENSDISDSDFSIYYQFAAFRLVKAESVLNSEFAGDGFLLN